MQIVQDQRAPIGVHGQDGVQFAMGKPGRRQADGAGGQARCAQPRLLGQRVVLAVAVLHADLPEVASRRLGLRCQAAVDLRLHPFQQDQELRRRRQRRVGVCGRAAADPGHAPVQPAGGAGDRPAGGEAIQPAPVGRGGRRRCCQRDAAGRQGGQEAQQGPNGSQGLAHLNPGTDWRCGGADRRVPAARDAPAAHPCRHT